MINISFNNMKQLFFILLFIPLMLIGQKNDTDLQNARRQIDTYGDLYFKLPINNITDLKSLPKYISVDSRDINGHFIKAYVSKKHFQDLLDLHLKFEVIPKKSAVKSLTMATTLSQMSNWDRYPTYDVYLQMMQKFANDHPGLTVLDTIGYSHDHRLVLALKITDNPQDDEDEPEFFYSAQMHGDELIGQVMMLRLADYLLTNYYNDPQVQNLVNNVEIWINPLANPDGLYNGTNNDVSNATRYLYNWIDPNRNFPSPNSTHPDGEAYAQETIDMMQFMSDHHFDLSANIHSGAEVANYPWDTWDTTTKTHPDNDWWIHVCSEYANTVFSNSNNGYFTDVTANGIIEGGDWYIVEGSRQDYMTYFKYGREITLELSGEKMLDAQLLPQYWNYNYRSLLKYMEQSLYGLRGLITDADTGEPLEAKVEIAGHDRDNSFVFSHLPVGDYHRYLKAGTYHVTYSKTGYVSQTITVQITDNNTTIQNVALQKVVSVNQNTLNKHITIYPNPIDNHFIKIQSNKDFDQLTIKLFNNQGQLIKILKNVRLKSGQSLKIPVNGLSSGIYFINLSTQKENSYKRIIIQ